MELQNGQWAYTQFLSHATTRRRNEIKTLKTWGFGFVLDFTLRRCAVASSREADFDLVLFVFFSEKTM
jgi:hypothetical protein